MSNDHDIFAAEVMLLMKQPVTKPILSTTEHSNNVTPVASPTATMLSNDTIGTVSSTAFATTDSTPSVRQVMESIFVKRPKLQLDFSQHAIAMEIEQYRLPVPFQLDDSYFNYCRNQSESKCLSPVYSPDSCSRQHLFPTIELHTKGHSHLSDVPKYAASGNKEVEYKINRPASGNALVGRKRANSAEDARDMYDTPKKLK